jgi:hypothetical protein
MVVGSVCYYYGGPAACIALPPANKVGCTVTTPDPPRESFIIVPESKIVKVRVSMLRAQKGTLIGKSGANIKSIEGTHGVRVRVHDDATSFTVRGTRTAVADAVEACRGLLKVPPSTMKPTRTPLQKARGVTKREIERGDLAIAPTPKHNLMDFLVPGSKKANRANKAWQGTMEHKPIAETAAGTLQGEANLDAAVTAVAADKATEAAKAVIED